MNKLERPNERWYRRERRMDTTTGVLTAGKRRMECSISHKI
jgi:hypothetical protein